MWSCLTFCYFHFLLMVKEAPNLLLSSSKFLTECNQKKISVKVRWSKWMWPSLCSFFLFFKRPVAKIWPSIISFRLPPSDWDSLNNKKKTWLIIITQNSEAWTKWSSENCATYGIDESPDGQQPVSLAWGLKKILFAPCWFWFLKKLSKSNTYWF